MIRSILYSKSRKVDNPSFDQIKTALNNPDDLTWVNLEHPSPEEMQSVLVDIFHFHPLAIEDCQTIGYQTPKVDDFSSYIFLIMQAISPDQSLDNADRLETRELNLFLGENYLVTCYQSETMHSVDHVWNRLKRDERLHQYGSDFLCHAILDALVDEYMPLIDHMDEDIEWLEDRVLAKPDPVTLQKILNLKHTIMSLRRIISPQREVINRLSRDDFPQIDRQSRIYFRDIYDHLVRIQDLSESIRDIVSGALDIYLNSTSLRLNEIMKALTIVSTVFLPMSFVAGVYGMNFQFMPEITWRFGYLMVWVIFISIFLGMLYMMKRRGWF